MSEFPDELWRWLPPWISKGYLGRIIREGFRSPGVALGSLQRLCRELAEAKRELDAAKRELATHTATDYRTYEGPEVHNT